MKLFSGFGGISRAFRHRDFAVYMAGNGISLVGTWMQRIATGWLTWELTKSGAWLGVMSFADLCPTILVGPIAGAAADRWPRLYVARLTQSLNFVQAVTLYFLAASGQMTIWLLFALTAIGGVITAFNQPARLALVPSLVPRQDIVAALAVNSVVFNLARFIGPAAAGLMIATTGLASAFAANAATFLAFLVALWRLDAQPAAGASRGKTSLGEDLMEGLRYSGSNRGVAALLFLSLVTSLLGRPVAELLPGFAADVFGHGADGLAMLTAAIGIGAVIGGLWLGGRSGSQGLTQVMLVGSLTLSLFTVVFTGMDRLWLALIVLTAVGFCMSCTGIANQTLIQLIVPNHMQGRVLGLYGLIVRAGPALGALGMGVASEYVGFRWPVAVGAALAAGVVFLFWLRQDRLSPLLERRDEG